jgi:hypothetical protein
MQPTNKGPSIDKNRITDEQEVLLDIYLIFHQS